MISRNAILHGVHESRTFVVCGILPRRYYDGETHLFEVRAPGRASVRLSNSSLPLRIPEVFGALERFVDGTLRAWVFSWQGYTQDLKTALTIDRQMRIETHQRVSRVDLDPSGFVGASGLAFSMPAELLDGCPHEVKLDVEGGVSFHISGSPRYLRFPIQGKGA